MTWGTGPRGLALAAVPSCPPAGPLELALLRPVLASLILASPVLGTVGRRQVGRSTVRRRGHLRVRRSTGRRPVRLRVGPRTDTVPRLVDLSPADLSPADHSRGSLSREDLSRAGRRGAGVAHRRPVRQIGRAHV